MVFFMHMMMVDRKTGLMMALGEQCIVSPDGKPCEPVTRALEELVVNE